MNNTCPKCGADYNGRPAPNQHDYWCGSTTWGDGEFYQSPECVRRERDQLVERNRELVEKIRRLEESIGEAYAEMRKHFPSVTAVFDRSVWEKAKEAKP